MLVSHLFPVLCVSLIFVIRSCSGRVFSMAKNYEEKFSPSEKRLVHSPMKKLAGTCPPWKPFQCPSGDCIPIKYLCDGRPDCGDDYDENKLMCTAVLRPPVEDTESFLEALLGSYGQNFFTKIFGEKAANGLDGLGGVHDVAVALSDSPTAEFFAEQLGLSDADLKQMKTVMNAVQQGGSVSEYGISDSEAADLQFYVEQLSETGFLK